MSKRTAFERAQALLEGMTPPPMSTGQSNARGILGRLEKMTGTAPSAIEIDPKRVKVWTLQGRIQESLNEEAVADLVESISLHDQAAPAVVRVLQGDPDFDYEVIDGSRRRFTCELLGKPLRAFVVDLSDLQAATLTETADTARKHSPYEVGLKWRNWLASDLFPTQEALAAFVGGSKGDVSFKLALAEVPINFVRGLGGHEKVSKDLGRRLAKLVSRARQTDRLEEVRVRLDAVGAGSDAAEATEVLNDVEKELFPPRLRTSPPSPAPLIADRAGRPALELRLQGTTAVLAKVARGVGGKERKAYFDALREFSEQWWSKNTGSPAKQ